MASIRSAGRIRQQRPRGLLVIVATVATASMSLGVLVTCAFSVASKVTFPAVLRASTHQKQRSATALAASGPTVLDPPAPPVVAASEGDSSPESSFAECRVSAAYRRGNPCGSGTCSPEEAARFDYSAKPQESPQDWKVDSEVWLFRQAYADDFSALLRKMGYHLPMLFRNVSVACEEKSLRDMASETCVDCIRHLTNGAYGEMGMIVPAHPDEKLRGRRDSPPVGAMDCLMQGKSFVQTSPDAGLFCRTHERVGSPGGVADW